MATMKSKDFVAKAIDIAKNYNTIYMWGVFGAPVTENVIAGKVAQYPSWYTAAKQAKFRSLIGKNYFGFDCVCLIKGILWGWSGDKNRSYGGATYASNGVPDIGADTMINRCSGVSTTGWASMIPGEVVWMSGHIGIYIGNGLAVECTPAWNGDVQITAVGNIGAKSGYNTRTWTKHGKLPYVDYSDQTSTSTTPSAPASTPTTPTTSNNATVPARAFSASIAGTYTTTANLNIRKGPSTSYASMAVLPKGTKVQNYGYYTEVDGVKWLYVQVTYKGVKYTGFVSSKYTSK